MYWFRKLTTKVSKWQLSRIHPKILESSVTCRLTHAFSSQFEYGLQSCMDIFISHLFCCTMPENLYNTYIFFHKKEIITPYQFWCKKYKFVVEQNTDCSIWFKSIYGSEKRRHLVASVRIKSENYIKFTYYAT